jgi:hypothetical protein
MHCISNAFCFNQFFRIGRLRSRCTLLKMNDPLKRMANIAKDKLGSVDDTSVAGLGGAVAGGLLLGPLGAVIGALASSSASGSQESRIPTEASEQATILSHELQTMQKTKQMVNDQVKTVAKVRQKFADREKAEYTDAVSCLQNDDEVGARAALTKRETTKSLFEKAQKDYDEASARYDELCELEGKLLSRLKEIEALVIRTRTAHTTNILNGIRELEGQ